MTDKQPDTLRAALAAPQQAAPALASLFREALAWGMAYGPAIPAHQWDEMRESMVAQYVSRAALAAPQPGYVLVPVEPTAAMITAGCPAGEMVDHFDIATAYQAMLAAAPQQEVQEPVWDGKLSDAMQNALDALSLECGPVIAKDIAHQVREECDAIYTSYTTTKRMYHAARDKLEAIESAQPQPDPFAAQPAPSGDAEDAARYRVIRNSIDLDEILKTVKDPGKWETPYAVLMRGAELDEAVDAARKETPK